MVIYLKALTAIVIFAGTAVDVTPFVLNAADPSGVTYQGNSGVNSIDLANGESAPINLPGNQIFTNASGNVFGALTQLINAVQSDSGIPAARRGWKPSGRSRMLLSTSTSVTAKL